MSNISKKTIDLFVNSLVAVMISDTNRVKVQVGNWIEDQETKLKIEIRGALWVMTVPSFNEGTMGIFLDDNHVVTLRNAIDKRANIILTQIHEKLYKNDQSAIIFSEIQKMRKMTPMVEEAWQNLLTVYALNVDSKE